MDIIKKSGGSYSAPLNEGSLVHRELMGDHYILLVFNTAEPQYFRLGDYCETDYGRFELVDLYEPEYDPEKGGYKYNLRLDAYYMKWKNKIIKFIPSSQHSEMSFTLTRDLEGQMELFMSNLAYLGTKDSSYLFNGSTAFTYDIDYAYVSHKMMPVTYDSISLIEALNRYAEQWECEWWVTDNCIHFGRCELGNSATNFKINDNVAEMSRTQGSKQYITRLYVFGSERNIPHNYRQDEGELVVNGVVQRRLMLPAGTPYLDAVGGLTEEQAVEGVLILDEVYPRTQCAVGTNGVSTYVSKGTDEEGNETTETFYRVSDSSGFINAIDETFRLPNESFHIQFTSGLLNGMTFNCTLVTNDNRIGKCFEIIANEDYGVKLPKVGFCPQDGDKYIIYGWDATRIENTNLITNAEAELVTEGNKYLAKSMVDPSEYTCTMISKKMQDLGMPVKYGQEGNEAYVPLPYDLGDRVNLQNPAIVGSSRSSRIIGYEIKLDIPADSPQFIVGESLRYSKIRALADKVDTVAYNGTMYQGGNGTGGGGSVYVIGTGDTTPASNRNVYSAIRSDNQYARKDRNDVIKSLWTFKNGNGVKRGLQTDDYLLNTNEGNPFGKGFELVSQTNAQGDTRTRLEIDELFVRIKAFFASLEIREISYVGGNYIFSAAGSKIYYVEWLDANGNVLSKTGSAISSVYKFRCYLYSDNGSTATINKWAVDDQIMCRTFNIDDGVHQNTSNKYYWRRGVAVGKEIIKTRALAAIEKQYLADVAAVNDWQVMTEAERTEQAQALADLLTAKNAAIAAVNAGNTPEGGADVEAFTQYNYVDISMADCDGGSDYPEDEDTIVQFGNWSNAARQGIIFLQVEGAGSPAIMEYAKVGADGRHFVIPDPTLLLSPTKNVIYGEFHSVVDSESGNTGSGDTIDDQLRALIDRLNDIQNQADKKFEMWFGTYVPLPNIIFTEVADSVLSGSNPASMGWYEVTGDRMYDTTEDTSPANGKKYYIKTDNNGTPNAPASEWDTDEKKSLHAQDLFYDTMREPASDGGRAWRWEAISVDGTVIYRWIETLDKDTIDALEKISDVATDGKLTGGAEKTRVYIEWMKAVQDYSKYEAQAIDYGLNDNVYWGENENIFVTYDTAFKKLARLLNGDDTTSESLYVANDILNGTVAPAWLADLSTTTVIPSPAIYREVWNNYYAALAALLKAIQKRAKELADQAQTSANEALNRIDGIAADGVLSTTEIPDLKREFETAYRQRAEMADLATDDTTHKLIDASLFAPLNTYLAAFKSLANYLNRQGGANGSGTYGAWTEPTGGTYSVSNSGTAANATYEIVVKSQLADADFPNLLGIDADVKFQANWASPTTDGDGGKKFRDLWADLERQRVALANAMATLTKETADGAQEAVDDLADDKILSAGSEKSKLLLEWLDVMSAYTNYTAQAVDHLDWLGTTGNEGTVRTALNTAKTTFVTKVKALGTFLNGGNSWATEYNAAEKPLPLYLGDDSTDGFAHDTNLTGHGQTAAGYRTCWSQYYDAYITLLKWLTQAGKIKTELAQADATEALNRIDGIAADGVLSTTEIPDLKREFETAYRQREEMTDLATDDTTHKLIDSVLRVPLDDYLSKFAALSNYLNQGSAWSEPTGGTYTVNNGSSVTDANATYNIVAKSPLADSDFPSLMSIISDVEFVANWNANPQVADNGAAFRNLWAALATAQVTLANAMATLAKNNADEANDRLDDIVSDGIISGGSEKTQLYKEWVRTKGEYFDYVARATIYGFNTFNTKPTTSKEYGYYQDKLAFEQAFDALVLMLNGGTYGDGNTEVEKDTVNRDVHLANGDELAWLYDLQADTAIGDYTYSEGGSTVAYTPTKYRQLWNIYYYASVKLLNDFTEYSKALADEALQQLSDIASDGHITPSEKETILLSWREVISELPILCSQADTFYDETDDASVQNQLSIYKSDYLGAFNDLAEILNDGDTYSYNVSSNIFPTPKWLSDYMTRTEELDAQEKAAFNSAWDSYYAERTYLQDLLLEVAKKSGDDALGELANLSADNVLTEFEKLTVLREWDAVYNEFPQIVTQAANAHVNCDAYGEATYQLGNYLIDLTDYTYERVEKNYQTPAILVTSGNTTINGAKFKTYWSRYYSERTKLLAAMSAKKVNYFVGSSVPATPYFVGDLWLKTASSSPTQAQAEDGEMFVCVVTRTSGTGQEADWANMKEITEKRDPRILLPMLAEKAYEIIGDKIRSNGYRSVYFKSSSPSGSDGNLWYNGSTLYKYTSSWVDIGSTYDGLKTVCASLYDILGTYTIKIFSATTNTSSKQKYDLCVTRIQFTDTNLPSGNAYRTVDGGIEIQMYNGSKWEILQESTRSLIENLKGYVRMVAFGSADGTIESAGIVTSQNFVNMFATAENSEGKTVAQAYLSAYVTKDSNGVLESGVKIRADKIDFQSGTLKIAANNIDFIGKTVINNKFVVDSDGNVTMNNFTATDATIKGNIFTPYLIIDSSNISNYATYTSDSLGNYYLLDLSKTGLNIQIDISTFSPYTYIKFPVGVKWLGAEANIYANGYCCIRDLSIINNVLSTRPYKTYHPILRKGQRMKIKCINDGGTYRWVPEFYTDIAQMNYPVILAQCTCEVGTYANGFEFLPHYSCLQGDGDFTFTRLGEGRYKVTRPSDWTGITFGSFGYPVGNVVIQMNNVGCYYDNDTLTFAYRKATLLECETDYFIVGVTDDDTANDGSFGFTIWQFLQAYNSFIV